MNYYVFVDNSNVWIEGKIASAVAKGKAKDSINAHENKIEDSSWRIDFGKLLKVVTDGDLSKLGQAVLIGSRPPHKDSLWEAIKKQNFEVEVLDRNAINKEKAVDTSIVQRIDKHLYRNASAGDAFVLVLGDRDYIPSVKAIQEEGCLAIIAFWDNVSAELVNYADKYINLTEVIGEITL